MPLANSTTLMLPLVALEYGQMVCALAPLKRLSSDDAEIVARAIAEGIAGGRKQGMNLAKAEQEA